jgi:hypothetical protein
MAKPAITTRATKGAALTYTELDDNFSNIKDATITITGGSTAVTADLNGTITLVAGTNVTITGNNSAKTITIASSGSSGLAINATSGDYEATADIDLNGNSILSDGGNINVGDDIVFPSGTGPFVPSGGTLLCRGGTITLETTNDPGINLSGVTTGTPSNTSTPSGYIKVTINSSTRYIPYYT